MTAKEPRGGLTLSLLAVIYSLRTPVTLKPSLNFKQPNLQTHYHH